MKKLKLIGLGLLCTILIFILNISIIFNNPYIYVPVCCLIIFVFSRVIRFCK
ncbi:hypothetical protein GCM10008917_15350 [Paraclostridium tenue]|uniref:Uncharacterized protein n=1 Tax=Paraclostridium tenue TaxID=1737 RepID=A0ABN1M3U6_9FIRM